jgi:hypothetical protein
MRFSPKRATYYRRLYTWVNNFMEFKNKNISVKMLKLRFESNHLPLLCPLVLVVLSLNFVVGYIIGCDVGVLLNVTHVSLEYVASIFRV